MAHIDQSKPNEKKWKNIASKCSNTIQRAAALQARELGIGNPAQEAGRLNQEYGVYQKGKDWREYGDVAFHLSAVYPPDFAIVVLYAFRHIVPKTRHDPVPYILQAVEKIFLLEPENIRLNIEINDEVKRLLRNSDERARKGR